MKSLFAKFKKPTAEVVTEPIPDGSFVETSFGRGDFNPTEESKRKYTDTTSAKQLGLDSKDVRAWANAHGYKVADRGRFSNKLVEAYLADPRTQVSTSDM